MPSAILLLVAFGAGRWNADRPAGAATRVMVDAITSVCPTAAVHARQYSVRDGAITIDRWAWRTIADMKIGGDHCRQGELR